MEGSSDISGLAKKKLIAQLKYERTLRVKKYLVQTGEEIKMYLGLILPSLYSYIRVKEILFEYTPAMVHTQGELVLDVTDSRLHNYRSIIARVKLPINKPCVFVMSDLPPQSLSTKPKIRISISVNSSDIRHNEECGFLKYSPSFGVSRAPIPASPIVITPVSQAINIVKENGVEFKIN
ncbi:TPA_asm: P3 [Pentaphragma betacytorhabdovirus 1]|nr:TPA_asm: P3 [Pentaphragma betacytorhabdovirus 1]